MTKPASGTTKHVKAKSETWHLTLWHGDGDDDPDAVSVEVELHRHNFHPTMTAKEAGALIDDSARQSVAEGKTLAHALEPSRARPFSEWPDLPARVQEGRRQVARGLLRLFYIGAPFPDFGADPVADIDLARALHDCERPMVDSGRSLVDLQRPWIEFSDLPPLAQEGRVMQARYLKVRAFFAPRAPADIHPDLRA
ncbi:MAG TPA: hypothetical protein P5234_16020 [Thermoanaerobaculaceae bacterium]|nr:hypothetical protein [Thermoanaerobaculaceae bacterium]HRU10505.1 hypothetical protein [Thermoanaerobaculia bacterium]